MFSGRLQKDLFKGGWSSAGKFFEQNYCHACHTRFAAFFPLPSCCVSSLLGSLSKGVFERRTSTGSEVFSLLTCLDDIKFVFLSFFTVIEAICLKICAKPPSKNEKRPLPVDVRRSKTLLLKLTIIGQRLCLKNVMCYFPRWPSTPVSCSSPYLTWPTSNQCISTRSPGLLTYTSR